MSHRLLVRVTGCVFLLSTAFPVVASLNPRLREYAWVGGLDVLLAAGVLLLAARVHLLASRRRDPGADAAAFRAYRALLNLPLLLLGLFLIGAEVDWTVLLGGLAWRMWLLGYVLPGWLVLARNRPGPDPGPPKAGSGLPAREGDYFRG